MNLRAPRFEELEARILYSADPLPGLVGFAPGIVEERHLLDNGEFAQAAAPQMQAESADRRHEVVFIDTGVPDWDLLLQDIRGGQTEDRRIDVLLIDAQRDGLEQVTQALAGRNDVAALHFITHGEAGAMRLGHQWIDSSSLHDASDAVARWGDSLTADADILLYGCDVAQGERGEAFVRTLARLTAADVAASDTVTGAAAKGGDWALEVYTGSIESAVAVSADGQRAYGALLQSSPQGGETLVNTTTAGMQESNNNMPPRTVAMDASGNFVVVWHGDGPGDINGIYAQRFDASGVAQGGEFRVNTGTAGVQNDPAVAMDAIGNFVIAWTSTVGDGSGEVVFAQRYDSSGVAQGGGFQVNTIMLNDQGQPAIAMSLNGFVIAWSDSAQDGSQHGVFAQRYDASGVAQGGELLVTTTTAGDQWIDCAAMDASGNFIVTWSTAQDGSALGVYSRRFDSSGTPLSGEVRVNSTTAGEQSWSSVAMNGSGAYVVTWRHHDGVSYEIHAQRYDTAGVAQGSEFRVNTTTASDQWPSSVAIDGNGNFVVTWSSYDQDSPGTWGVYKQEYFANGAAASTQTLVATTTAGNQDWSSVVMNASGAYVVAWSGNGAGDASGIFFQRYVHNAPTITSNAGAATASINVAENTTAVTTVTATDADAGTTLSYSIVGGADAARFTINATTGALSFISAPDREIPTDSGGDNVYDVTVQVSDGDLTDTQAIAVTVTNVNDNAPVITSFGGGANASLSIAENSTVAFGVSATDADAGTTLSYSIVGGADAAHFSINSSTGALNFGIHDHETPTDADANNVYDVIVQASDGTLTDTQAIAVTITNVNDNAPVITSGGGGASASQNVAENTTAVTIVTASDADASAAFDYSIVGGADAASFTINPTTGALSFVAAPDRENPIDAGANNVYDVVVQVSDGAMADTQAIAVTVTNANDNTPVITSDGGGAGAAVNVVENTGAVTTVTASDADASTTLTYSIAGGADAVRFTINSTTGALAFVAAPDREAPTDSDANNVYDVVVQASDGALTDTQSISVTVTNVNDNAPVITSNGAGAAASLNVAENSSAVTTVTATDADSATLTYSIAGGADAARFTINATTGALAFVAAPDHESPTDTGADNVYDVTVQVSDGSLVDTQSIAVTVTDVNDNTPVITSDGGGATAARSVAENGTAVTTVTASDADAGAALGYSITGGADAARFTIDATTGALGFVAAPDYETPTDAGADNVYDVIVRVSDGNFNDSQAITVTVTNVDDNPPVITSDGGGATASMNVAENGSAVTTVTATDPDLSSTVSYSIVGGADAARFAINATTGVLSFVPAPDFETPTDSGANNVYDVVVQASDGALADTQAIAVTVTNLNDNAPLITSDGGGANAVVTMAENGTAVTTVAAVDADATGVLAYSIAGGADAARFTINGTTGALSFVSASDHEAPSDSGANNVYDVVVQVSDGSFTDSQAIAVTVANLNDNTPVITSDGAGAAAAVSVAENGTAVTMVTASDADAGAAFSYSIAGGVDAARFAINATTGVLAFVGAPDHEAPTDGGANNVYDVVVQVSDGSFTDSQAIAVTVTNQNDNPPLITSNGAGATASLNVAENNTAVTDVTAADADAGATLSYSIVGGADAARFTINGTTGALGFVSAPNHEAPTDAGADNVYDVTVQVSDGSFSDSQAVAVTVLNVNEDAPVITSGAGADSTSAGVAENTNAVTTVTATDVDAGTTLGYSIVGGADAAHFTIDPTTGVLSFVTAPDHEAPGDANADNVYDVVVQASDGTLSDTQAIAVTIIDTHDVPPVITSNGGGPAASLNVAENFTAVTTTSSISVGAPTYSIVGGADAALFTIDATTGMLRFVAAPDFETPADADANNVYHVVVQVFDGGLTDTQAVTVVVGNMSESPAALGDVPFMSSPSFVPGFAPTSSTTPPAAPTPTSREQGPRAQASAAASEAAAPNAQRAITSTTRGLTGGSNFDRVTSREARAIAGATSTTRKSSAAGDATAGTLTERRVALDDFIAQGVDDTVLKLDGGFQLLAPQGSHRSAGEAGASQRAAAFQDDEPGGAMNIDIDTVRYAGVALSAGVVWWVTRAGGLVASMLATAPAWRHLDLLPVLAANDKREDAAEAVLDTAEEQVAQDMLER